MYLKTTNLKSYKTTILGIVLIAMSIAGVFLVVDLNIWIFITGLAVGISMLFVPDAFINALITFIHLNKKTVIKDGCNHDHENDKPKDDLKQ